jgi:hypothetical protein
VELPDALQTEAFKKLQEKQRHARTSERKFKRSNSASSGDTERSCREGSSTHSLPVEANSAVTPLQASKSLSKLYSSSSTSKVPSGTADKTALLPNYLSPNRTKSTLHAERASHEPPCSPVDVRPSELCDSDSDTSSTETSSSSRSSNSSDEDDEGLKTKYQNCINLQHSTENSVTAAVSQQISVTPVPKVPSNDELPASVDKPPRPPVSPKPHKSEESKSFLMRALAPVTNLFRGKQESNISEGLLRTDSTQSLNKSGEDDEDVKKTNAVDKSSSQHSVSAKKQKAGTGLKTKDESDSSKFNFRYKIRKQESGERAWWMDSNPNIPEGIRRIGSSTSINNSKNMEEDSNKTDDVKNVSSSYTSERLQEYNSYNRSNGEISHQESEEPASWLGSTNNIPEGGKVVQSSTSTNALQGGEKVEANTERYGVHKTPSGMSLHKNKDSEHEDARPSVAIGKVKEKLHRLRHQQSGELPWWLDSSAPVPEGIKRIESNTSVNKLQDPVAEVENSQANRTEKSEGVQKTPSSISLRKGANSDSDIRKPPVGEEKTSSKLYRLQHQQSGELPWWLDNNAPVPEGVQRIQSSSSVDKLQACDSEKGAEEIQRIRSSASINKHQDSDGDDKTTNSVRRLQSSSSLNKVQSSDSDSKKSGTGEKVKKKIYRIRHQESGELPRLVDNNMSQSEGVQRVKSSHSISRMQEPEQKEEVSNTRGFPYKLRHQESGEKAWWLSSRGDVPEGVKRLDSNQSLSEYLKSGTEKQKKTESSSSDSSEEDVTDGSSRQKQKSSDNVVPKFPLVLPATALQSDSSLPTQGTGRRSPYDNIQEPQLKAARSQATKPRPKNLPLFIGSHTNIDDILGSAASLVNPVMGLSRLRRKHESQNAGSSHEEGNVKFTVTNLLA